MIRILEIVLSLTKQMTSFHIFLQQCMFEYWSRPDIHTFGNVGFGGAVHAAMAPIATKVRIVTKT